LNGLLDQTFFHQLDADEKSNDFQDENNQEVEYQAAVVGAVENSSGNGHGMGQGHEQREGLHPARELVQGKEDAGKEEHGRDDQFRTF